MSAATELAEVLALLEKATPGEWVPVGFGMIQRTEAGGGLGSAIASTGGSRCMWDDWQENTPAIAAAVNFLRAHGPALAQMAEDAERYRWLRAAGDAEWNTGQPFIGRQSSGGFSMWTGEYADDAIDAAMTEQSP